MCGASPKIATRGAFDGVPQFPVIAPPAPHPANRPAFDTARLHGKRSFTTGRVLSKCNVQTQIKGWLVASGFSSQRWRLQRLRARQQRGLTQATHRWEPTRSIASRAVRITPRSDSTRSAWIPPAPGIPAPEPFPLHSPLAPTIPPTEITPWSALRAATIPASVLMPSGAYLTSASGTPPTPRGATTPLRDSKLFNTIPAAPTIPPRDLRPPKQHLWRQQYR